MVCPCECQSADDAIPWNAVPKESVRSADSASVKYHKPHASAGEEHGSQPCSWFVWPASVLEPPLPSSRGGSEDSCRGMLAECGSRQLPLVSPGQGTVVMAWKWEGLDARKPFWPHPGPRSSQVWDDCASQSLAAPGDQGVSSTPEGRHRLAGQRAWLMDPAKKVGNKKRWGKQD